MASGSPIGRAIRHRGAGEGHLVTFCYTHTLMLSCTFIVLAIADNMAIVKMLAQ